MRFLPVLLALSVLGPCNSACSSAQDYQGDKHWKAVCKAAMASPLQAPRLTGPLTPAQLPQCKVEQMYYGDGVHGPNYPAALQCGWYQRAHPEPSVGDMFLGPGVLTMLYANGDAVPRNVDLAIRFACEDQWTADAEGEGRIGHLEALRDGRTTGRFDLCDDITSGLSMGACQGVDSTRRQGTRASKIAAAVAGLPAPALALLPTLRAAEDAFEQGRAGDEIDMSGTARGMFFKQERSTLADQFLINLQRFRKGDVPPATAQNLAALDGSLNSTYRALMDAPASQWQFGTIKPEGIRDTERAWLKLVDAWLQFGRAAYPGLGDTRLRAQLIRLRLHQLQSLARQ